MKSRIKYERDRHGNLVLIEPENGSVYLDFSGFEFADPEPVNQNIQGASYKKRNVSWNNQGKRRKWWKKGK